MAVVIRTWDTDDDVFDEETDYGVACAPSQQNANSTNDSSPHEFRILAKRKQTKQVFVQRAVLSLEKI